MSGPVLVARDVEVRYGRAAKPAVVDASLELQPGDALGIVGESGSGKTTLAHALVGLIPPTRGQVAVHHRRWSEIHWNDAVRRRVQMVFQDPYGSLNPRMTPLQTIAEVLTAGRRAKRSSARAQAATLLESVGVSGDTLTHRNANLSGGQCQRVSLARAVANEPDVLVADEPTSALDVSVQAQILNLIDGLRTQRNMALVLIAHDLSVVRQLTSRLIVMYRGHIVEEGATDEILSAPCHPYTKILLDAVPGRWGPMRTVEETGVPDSGCVFASRCPMVDAERCAAGPPPTVPVGPRHSCVCVRAQAGLPYGGTRDVRGQS